jgi:hypothetical protein
MVFFKVKKSGIFFIGTNTREKMIVSRIFRMVMWQLVCDNFGDLEMVSAQSISS